MTTAAVSAFQKAAQLTVTGKVAANDWKALSGLAYTKVAPAPVTTAGLYAAYGSLTLAAGSTGWPVRDLQLELNRRGYSVGTADGDFGAMTTAAVSAFQKAAQLTVTGKVAANDWKALSGLAYTKVAPPAPAPVTTTRLYAAYGSLTLAAGATGWPVRDLELELNRRGYSVGTADGNFGAQTTTAVSAFQKAAQLTVTGKVAANDWKALSGLAYTKVKPPLVLTTAPRGGFNSDGRGDVLGRTQTGDLLLYPVIGAAVGTPAKVGTGWGAFAQVLSPGDFDGDRFSDVLALTPTGAVWLYRGNGRGGFKPGKVLVGTGFSTTTLLLAPGDWTGDGKPDLLARKANGELWLLTGNGAGGFVGTARQDRHGLAELRRHRHPRRPHRRRATGPSGPQGERAARPLRRLRRGDDRHRAHVGTRRGHRLGQLRVDLLHRRPHRRRQGGPARAHHDQHHLRLRRRWQGPGQLPQEAHHDVGAHDPAVRGPLTGRAA